MVNALLLLLGLALLIGGADLLVRGMSAIAKAMGVPPLVVGLTLVAFGTSLPEVMINTLSARHGQTDLAFGNIIGSCSINIGFVLAVTALIRPLKVEAAIIVREIPMMLLGVAALVVLSEDEVLNGGSENVLLRGDGLILLLLFAVFLYYVIKDVLVRSRQPILGQDAMVAEVAQNIESGKGLVGHAMQESPMWKNWAMSIAGLLGVAIGGRVAVYAAVHIAEALNVPQNIIGLTLVSFGTTLPELATSVTAGRRGQGDIAIGNIVGSNIFNILFIGGMVSTINPIEMPPGGQADLLFLAAQSVVLLPITIRGGRMITRAEGAFLLVAYLVFVIWRTSSAM